MTLPKIHITKYLEAMYLNHTVKRGGGINVDE